MSPLGKSEHSVLHCVCNLYNKNTVNVSKFNFNKGDYKSLCEYLSNNFDACYFKNCTSVNDSWMYLKSILESGQELFIPHIENNAWKKKGWQFPIHNSRTIVASSPRIGRSRPKEHLVQSYYDSRGVWRALRQ